MTQIIVETSDCKIWNQDKVYRDITVACCNNNPFEINLNNEGPAVSELGLYEFLETTAAITGFDLSKITLITANPLEQHPTIQVKYVPAIHLAQHARVCATPVNKHNNLKTVGIFIGRSNAPRLWLSSYMHQQLAQQTVQSFHYSVDNDFHRQNIGLEDLIQQHGQTDVSNCAAFLSQCPVVYNQRPESDIRRLQEQNASQQLLAQDQDLFVQQYSDFLVEIVCETYFTGNTFFITEKTYRPMILRTPFLVQGPRYFIKRLQQLGFQTFDKWWDEGYSEDHTWDQVTAIIKTVSELSKLTPTQRWEMYKSMEPVLEHNYNLAMELSARDLHFWKLCHE